jgi:hypothetical protein
MPTYTPIYVRSPRIIERSGADGDEIVVNLHIWNSPATEPVTPTVVLSKPIPSSTVTTAYFDISPYLREYLSFTTSTTVTVETATPVDEYCFCTAYVYKEGVLHDTQYFVCFDGYGYFLEGNNPTVDPVLMDEGTYYYESSNQDNGNIVIHDNGVDTWTATYVFLPNNNNQVLNITNEVSSIPTVLPAWASGGNRVVISKNAVAYKTFYFIPICEAKYTILKCDFVNKAGAWQRINFFKVSTSSFDMNNKEYKLMPENIDYSIEKNINQTFNTNGHDKITCNTGWVNDGYADVMKQLLLSEEIRLDDVPVQVAKKSLELMKSINDNNINYSIDFVYSFSTVNYIV